MPAFAKMPARDSARIRHHICDYVALVLPEGADDGQVREVVPRWN